MSGERILIVEDNEPLAQVYCRALVLNGYAADWVTTGAAAMAFLDHRRPDLVMIDLSLPDTNGVMVAQNFRMLGLTCPLIAMSGAMDLFDRDKIIKSGDFIEAISKPAQLAQIIKVVGDALSGKQSTE